MTTTAMLIKQLREATYASFLDCSNALKAHDGDYDKALEQLRASGLRKADKVADRETLDGLIVVGQTERSVCAIELNCETDFVARTQEFRSFAHCVVEQVLGDPALTDAERVLAADYIDAPGQTVAMVVKELAGKLGENIQLGRVARYEQGAASVLEGYIHAGAIDGYGPMEGRAGVLVELGVEDPAAVNDSAALQALAHDLALQIASDCPRYVSIADIPAEELDEQRQEFAAQLANQDKPDAIKARIIEGQLNKFYRQTCLLSQDYVKEPDLTVEGLLQQAGAEIGSPVAVVRFARFELNT